MYRFLLLPLPWGDWVLPSAVETISIYNTVDCGGSVGVMVQTSSGHQLRHLYPTMAQACMIRDEIAGTLGEGIDMPAYRSSRSMGRGCKYGLWQSSGDC